MAQKPAKDNVLHVWRNGMAGLRASGAHGRAGMMELVPDCMLMGTPDSLAFNIGRLS